jgi:uncharacterized Fe-S center protein
MAVFLEDLQYLWERIKAYFIEREFNWYYDLVVRTTAINKDSSGVTTSIEEVTTDAVATTTFSKDGSTTVIETTVVPYSGQWNYVKNTTIATGATQSNISETFSKILK